MSYPRGYWRPEDYEDEEESRRAFVAAGYPEEAWYRVAEYDHLPYLQEEEDHHYQPPATAYPAAVAYHQAAVFHRAAAYHQAEATYHQAAATYNPPTYQQAATTFNPAAPPFQPASSRPPRTPSPPHTTQPRHNHPRPAYTLQNLLAFISRTARVTYDEANELIATMERADVIKRFPCACFVIQDNEIKSLMEWFEKWGKDGDKKHWDGEGESAMLGVWKRFGGTGSGGVW